ncbi:IclR family transcriptional regulator [Microvirga brassicacearum]|nr:helix-turn-helix domain-containing protein [Microvirga brassicacearum]
MTDRDDEYDAASRVSYSAPALEKGLDILELLAEAGEPLSTRAIADQLGRSKSEIFRMVFVLQQRGYLVREPETDHLMLSRHLFDLGIRTPRGRQLTSIVVPHMERFSDSTGQGAHLVVISRAETVVVATTAGHLDASVTIRLGYGRPALEANSGMLILAFQPEHRLRALMREAPADVQRLLDAPQTRQRLVDLRERGYQIAQSRDIVGVTDLAFPVVGQAGYALACVLAPCLQRHDTQIDETAVLSALRKCCEDAGAQISSE